MLKNMSGRRKRITITEIPGSRSEQAGLDREAVNLLDQVPEASVLDVLLARQFTVMEEQAREMEHSSVSNVFFSPTRRARIWGKIQAELDSDLLQ